MSCKKMSFKEFTRGRKLTKDEREHLRLAFVNQGRRYTCSSKRRGRR